MPMAMLFIGELDVDSLLLAISYLLSNPHNKKKIGNLGIDYFRTS